MKTILINIKDAPKFDSSALIYIGRGSIWGNPFHIDPYNRITREKVISLYEEYIRESPVLLNSLSELVGKVLMCHCVPLPCHGEVLLKLLRERGLDDD